MRYNLHRVVWVIKQILILYLRECDRSRTRSTHTHTHTHTRTHTHTYTYIHILHVILRCVLLLSAQEMKFVIVFITHIDSHTMLLTK